MEAHTNSVNDVLVDALSFKLKNSARYVTDRRSVTFHPSAEHLPPLERNEDGQDRLDG